MQLLAQRGANVPFVGTGVPTVSFSALSSNSIYSMIITYGGGGGSTDLLGWSTNIAGAGMISNSMPIVQFNGTLYVPGTLLAGNLASALNPGTTTIYNIRTDTGTAAGTFVEGSIGLNGTRALGLGGYVNDVGSVSNMTVTAYGGFIVKSNAFLTPPTLAEGDAWFFTSNAIPHVRYRLGGVNITTRLVP